MRLATWNVNSLRVRLPQVLDWLKLKQPDVLCLQETKVTDGDFPQAPFDGAGYRAVFTGQKAYNGVAIISRVPAEAVEFHLPGVDSEQKRFLAATIGDLRVVNVYVPNGEHVQSEKFQYKLSWLRALRRYLTDAVRAYPQLTLAGDFNIAPENRDVHDPTRWEGQVLFSEPERTALAAVRDAGFTDVFRQFDQPQNSFTWWDYRQGGYRKNQGLRIDHIFAGPGLVHKCRGCFIDQEPRSWPRPSDHAAVVADFVL